MPDRLSVPFDAHASAGGPYYVTGDLVQLTGHDDRVWRVTEVRRSGGRTTAEVEAVDYPTDAERRAAQEWATRQLFGR